VSGGSFEYLYALDVGDLFMKYTDTENGTLAEMRDALIEYGDAEDVAAETERLRLDLAAFRVRIEAKMGRLSPIWHAVEWHHSGDSGPENVRAAIEKYRGGA
jgi:hypothetical protein